MTQFGNYRQRVAVGRTVGRCHRDRPPVLAVLEPAEAYVGFGGNGRADDGKAPGDAEQYVGPEQK
ncbi:hypothetical protein ACWC6I_41360 [Streptomyces sp. NPDC001414]